MQTLLESGNTSSGTDREESGYIPEPREGIFLGFWGFRRVETNIRYREGKRMMFPCKNCEKRYLGCHDKCEEYQIAKAASQEQSRKIREEHNNNATLYKMRKSRIRSMKNKNNTKIMRGK